MNLKTSLSFEYLVRRPDAEKKESPAISDRNAASSRFVAKGHHRTHAPQQRAPFNVTGTPVSASADCASKLLPSLMASRQSARAKLIYTKMLWLILNGQGAMARFDRCQRAEPADKVTLGGKGYP